MRNLVDSEIFHEKILKDLKSLAFLKSTFYAKNENEMWPLFCPFLEFFGHKLDILAYIELTILESM